MRVSEYFHLKRTQPTLDFVDVDVVTDTVLFVDPRALRLLPTRWGRECVGVIQGFFRLVLEAIRTGDDDRAKSMLASLREKSGTHLGFSVGRERGTALGTGRAVDVWNALRESEAARSGLLEDLEDTILFIPGIGPDIISDITIGLIRGHLIEYTHACAELYQIPLTPDVDSGPLWDARSQEWTNEFVALPTTEQGPLTLIPKTIVRRHTDYDDEEYYRHYILPQLQQQHLDGNTELVRLLKSGERRVNKKDLEERHPFNKGEILRLTIRDPEILRKYRADKNARYRSPLTHEELAAQEGTEPVDWDALLNNVLNLAPGKASAVDYEDAIEALASALFYPDLGNPEVQKRIHNGRKVIDIVYGNLAQSGFFGWLGLHYPAAMIVVECKNYNSDPANPELDQIAGRFSPNRGRVGLLVCREINDKELFIQRCIDTASDDRGFIIPLDDADLRTIVEERRRAVGSTLAFPLLRQRFGRLIGE